MNVLQVNSVCGIGSTGRIVTDIVTALEKKGYNGSVGYGRYKPIRCDNNMRIGTDIHNYFHLIGTRLFDRHAFCSKRSTEDFIKKIKKINPDIIHLHNLHGYYIHVGLLFEYLRVAKKPIIWTLHDCWPFTGHCSHYDFNGCEKWKTECNKCDGKTGYPKSIFIDASRNNYQKKKKLFTGLDNLIIVTPSIWLSSQVKMSYLCDYPHKVINNGVDVYAFRPINSDFRSRYKLQNAYIILGVANVWTDRKGYKVIMGLAKMLKCDEVIVLVGVSEEQIAQLPKGVIGIKKTDDIKSLAEIYSAADIFINPTLEEVLGLVNLESMACGTPVITFNVGGSPECIDDKCGVLVERGDLIGLVSAIENVKRKGKKHYAVQCRQRVLDCFNKENCYKGYVELYESCLK